MPLIISIIVSYFYSGKWVFMSSKIAYHFGVKSIDLFLYNIRVNLLRNFLCATTFKHPQNLPDHSVNVQNRKLI